MVKVELPRASWEFVLAMLENHDVFSMDTPLKDSIVREMSNQIYSQEY
jgi:hypothetical protein